MNNTRLNNKDFKLLKRGGSYIVGNSNAWEKPIYGLDVRDYAEFHVYDMDGNLLKSSTTTDFILNDIVRIKPGDDLRKAGFFAGTYKVKYNFFRCIAGANEVVLTYTTYPNINKIYTGKPWITGFAEKDYIVNDDGKVYINTYGQSEPVELDIKEYKYFIQEISPSRTEVRLVPQDIDQEKYKKDFENLYAGPKIYTPDTTDEYGDATFTAANNIPQFTFNLNNSDAGITEDFLGATIEIENAFIVGYKTESMETYDNSNSVSNSGGEEIDDTWNPSSVNWDINLHEDAVKVKNWSAGYNGGIPSPNIGYHGKWVKYEGRNNSTCIKFIDKNDQFVDDSGNSIEHRWLGIAQNINNVKSSGLDAGDKIKITWWQKSDTLNKGAKVGLYHVINNFNNEPMPSTLPNGLDLSEPVPTDSDIEEFPLGTISPNRRWIQSGESYVFWSLRFLPESGSLSAQGGWGWNGTQWITTQESPSYSFEDNITTTIVNKIGEWEKHTFITTIGSNWDLDSDFKLYIYGNSGNNGILWIDDIKISYIYSKADSITPIYKSYKSTIKNILTNKRIVVDESWYDQALKVGHIGGELNNSSPNYPFKKWKVIYKTNDANSLNTLLNFNNNELALVVNWKKDDTTISKYPYSIIYKLYKPLPQTIEKGDLCYVVREMIPPHEDTVKLINYIDDDINANVLRSPNLESIDSPIGRGNTYYKTISDILTNDPIVSQKIEDKFLSSSFDSVNLNIDYRNFNNFIHFSSIERRIKNFKSKLEFIETNVSASASYAQYNFPATASLTSTIQKYERSYRKIINEFDDFESYMYYNSSSYYSSSEGEFFDNAWPKIDGNGTINSPYILASSTSSIATNWYDIQISSASLYDKNNRNRLSYQLPTFIKENSENEDYLKFIDMIAHHFDNIWIYIKNMSDIYNRSDKLDEGISKDLLYSVAKSFGWKLEDGKSLIELPRYAFGYKITGSNSSHSVYSTVAEQDISREIWSRIINNMPFFLKTKGTIRALRGLISCYGIPPTILRIKEYGGPDINDDTPSYEIERKFTKAIDFKGSQYVKTTWANDPISGRKPDTVEFRFKTGTGSNQTLIQAGDAWGIRLKDNNSNDNYGHISFMLNGAGSYIEISSSQLPVYDNEFYSVMLRRTVLPTTASYVNNNNGISYQSSKLKLSDISKFPNTGKITIKNSENKDITLEYTEKNSGTNELLGIKGWPKRQIKSNDTTRNIAPIPSASIVTPMLNLASDGINQNIKYELFIKKYDASRNKIQYESISSIIISGSEGVASSSYNANFTGSQSMYIGGYNTTFGSPFSGSMMEFRYWTIPLNESSFDNHVASPKSYNGNHISSSYTDLVLRYSFDDNINHSVNSSVRDTSANQTYTQTGSAIGFLNEVNYSSIEEDQNSFIPNIGALRRTSNKIRIEDNILTGQLNVNSRAEKGMYDSAPIDSNKAGIYFAPTDVINEDIILSVANLNFDNYIGDPRDLYELSYRGLRNIADTYWRKYTSPNNFWAYLRLIKYYDQSMFDQLKLLIPARTKAKFGVLVEQNILERSKNSIIKIPTWENNTYDSTINIFNIEEGLSQISMSGDYSLLVGSSSYSVDVLQSPSLYKLDSYPIYTTASLSDGTPLYVFEEGVQPFISSSRLSEHNQELKYYYSSSYSQSLGLAYSSSFMISEYDNHTTDFTGLFNLFYGGCKQTKNTMINDSDPIVVTLTSPTVLVTKEPGESKLEVR